VKKVPWSDEADSVTDMSDRVSTRHHRVTRSHQPVSKIEQGYQESEQGYQESPVTDDLETIPESILAHERSHIAVWKALVKLE
jgi:hypothetical protein